MPWEPHLVPRPPKATEGPRSLRVCKGPRHMLTNTDSIFLIPLLHWTKLQFKSHDCAFISTNIYIYIYTHTHTHTHTYIHTRVHACCLSMMSLGDPMDLAHQAPLSMKFSKQEYWSGLPFPSPEDLLNPGIEPRSPALQADSLPSESPGSLAPSKTPSLSVHEIPGPCHSHPPRASYRTGRQLRLSLPHPGHAFLKN